LAAFVTGPLWWMLVGIQVLLIVGVTISELDIGITVGSEETGDVAMAALPPVGEGGSAAASAGVGDGGNGATGGDSATGGDVAAGATVFASNCAACHGPSGEGGVGPALTGRSLGSGVVSSVVQSGRGLMPSFASTLSSDEIAAVAAYVSGLGSESDPGADPGEAGSGTATDTAGGSAGGSVSGRAVFASNCAACHGASGQGGVGPALAGRSLSSGVVSSVVGSGRGLMPSFASTLSSEEVAAVAAYVSGLGGGSGSVSGATTDPGSGTAAGTTGGEAGAATGGATGGSVSGSVVFASNCAACHGPAGEGGIGPTLAGRSLSSGVVSSVVGSGRGLMPSFASTLSSEEVAAVAVYVSGLGTGSSSGSGGTQPPPPAPQLSGPAEVFSFYCAACHGADGRGTALAPYILDRGDHVFKTVRRGDDPMPSFSPDVISDAELRALADYIAGLDPDNDDDEDRSGSNSGSG
jgi:mono/diheme cytochrome c family protein